MYVFGRPCSASQGTVHRFSTCRNQFASRLACTAIDLILLLLNLFFEHFDQFIQLLDLFIFHFVFLLEDVVHSLTDQMLLFGVTAVLARYFRCLKNFQIDDLVEFTPVLWPECIFHVAFLFGLVIMLAKVVEINFSHLLTQTQVLRTVIATFFIIFDFEHLHLKLGT
jgi:hypothetical protein